MTLEPEDTERLFAYGTLQTEAVQLSIFGRRLEAQPDVLVGYCLATIRVEDQSFITHSGAVQRNLQHTGNASDLIEGLVLSLTQQEIERADAYEPAEYKRVQVRLRSGSDAWVYLKS